MKLRIETIGNVIKEETLATVDFKILPGSFVLETVEPFPGYHHHNPQESLPTSIFIITKKYYGREEVARMSQNICQYFPHPFDAASCQITIYNKTLNAIRIMNLPGYDLIEDLQKCILNEDVSLAKYKKIHEKAIIRIKKFFSIEPSEDENIFHDLKEDAMSYLLIPRQLSWKKKKKITYAIKNNWDFKDFDAALGNFYMDSQIKDMVRIFAKGLEFEKLALIREKYLTELSRLDH